jgi:twitching motility protein PilT
MADENEDLNELMPATAPAVPKPESRDLKDMEKLFVACARNKASDLHLKPGQRVIFRVNTILHEVGAKVLTPEDTKRLIYEVMTPVQRQRFEEEKDLDFAYSVEGVGRYRVNVFLDRGTIGVAARRVNTDIPTFEQLHLPEGVRKVSGFNQGMVIVAGPTGSGKSTTLACLLDYINLTEKCHVVTIEDPIEYLFTDKKSFFSQREIGIDVDSFPKALKHVVRQDPDVILVGEMRDVESFDAGLIASETGHLVFGTIHASSASQCIGRLLDLFPTERQPLIRQSLSFNLKTIICQRLLPACKEGVKMVPAIEIMLTNSTIQKLIQSGEDKKIHDCIRGGEEEGMQDFNQSIVKLINAGLVNKKVGMAYSPNPEQLKMNLQGIYLGEDRKILG